MIFGNKEEFSIQCNLENQNNLKSVFGYIVIWINNEKLGQSSLIVSLDIPVTYFQKSLNYCGNRQEKKFVAMKSLEIFHFLEFILWGEPDDNSTYKELIENDERYSKFNICTNFSESFDGESLYLIEDQKQEKFIWKGFHSNKVQAINLPLGTYEKVVTAFLDWFNSQIR